MYLRAPDKTSSRCSAIDSLVICGTSSRLITSSGLGIATAAAFSATPEGTKSLTFLSPLDFFKRFLNLITDPQSLSHYLRSLGVVLGGYPTREGLLSSSSGFWRAGVRTGSPNHQRRSVLLLYRS